VSVEEELSEELEALPSRDIVLGIEESLVIPKHLVVVCFQELRTQQFMTRKELLIKKTFLILKAQIDLQDFLTLNVEKASEAMSKVETSTYSKNL